MNNDPRHIALKILNQIDKKKYTLDKCLDMFEPDISTLSRRDRNLCNAIIHGILRTRLAIDWIIIGFTSRSIEKIDPYALNILRIALYQIIYMDRIPVSAAVNTAVEISKKTTDKRISGFINAVLRKASTGYKSIAFPDERENPSRALSVKNSIPVWLINRWIDRYSIEKTRSLCEAVNTIPLITVRTNTLKINRIDLFNLLAPCVKNISLTPLAGQGISFQSPDDPIHEMDSFKKGFFQIQDEAAQIVTLLLDPKPGETILDACAGLGGKTGHLAELMANTGKILAADTDQYRLDQLSGTMKRLGIDIVTAKLLDLLTCTLQDVDGYFDRILLDAPCTGLGVLKRNPDTRWTKSQKDITRLAAKQKKLLNNAANLVKPGGCLLYTVCSCEPEENEGVILSFLKKRKDFSINPERPASLPLKTNNHITPHGFFSSYPDAGDMDGFFAASLIRKAKA